MVKISRKATTFVHAFIDAWIPAWIRDVRFFNALLFRLVLGRTAPVFLDFRERAYAMSDDELYQWNRRSLEGLIERDSDLNAPCVEKILAADLGQTVLDVGCGRGFLSRRMAATGRAVTACDAELVAESKDAGVTFVRAQAESLPFAEKSFDTVVCTHVLEHVRHPWDVIRSLRKIARRKLIVVVPLQREFRYTPDLHLHYFPYPQSFLLLVEPERVYRWAILGGDLYYEEDV